jgi:hypothetical protein
MRRVVFCYQLTHVKQATHSLTLASKSYLKGLFVDVHHFLRQSAKNDECPQNLKQPEFSNKENSGCSFIKFSSCRRDESIQTVINGSKPI